MQVSTQWGKRQEYRGRTRHDGDESDSETIPGSRIDSADEARQDRVSDEAARDPEPPDPESRPDPPGEVSGMSDETQEVCDALQNKGATFLDGNRNGHLVRAVEAQIIPRLLMAHRQDGQEAESSQEVTQGILSGDLVERMSDLVRNGRETEAVEMAEKLRRDGVSLETLFLDLLAPTARRLGEMWDDDTASFADVTMGLWRLQQLMRQLSPTFQTESSRHARDRKALLAPVPGEQHVFGIAMVAEFFHRAGWETFCAPLHSVDQLVEMVGGEWFNVAGLSVSSENQLDDAKAAIRAIRERSANPNIGIMVGGHIFQVYPELVHQLGADTTAPGGAEAPARAAELVDVLSAG